MAMRGETLGASGLSALRRSTPILQGLWVQWWRFLRRKPLGGISAIIILVLLVMAVFAGFIDRYDPFDQQLPQRLLPPSGAHWFGTDYLGRDIYSRIVHGSRSTVYVGFLSILLGVSTGSVLGLMSGYFGGKTDLIVQRFIDSVMAFPPLLLGLAIGAVLSPSNNNTLFIIALIITPGSTRLVRGTTLSLKNNVYVEAARAIGASTPRILFRHILPNTFAVIIILISVGLGGAILVDASLRFLGVGKPDPDPAWGLMLAGKGRQYLETSPWLAVAPAVAISMGVLAFNLLGDAIRDVLDPRLRGR